MCFYRQVERLRMLPTHLFLLPSSYRQLLLLHHSREYCRLTNNTRDLFLCNSSEREEKKEG